MRKAVLMLIVATMGAACASVQAQPRKGMDAYFIDVEGGQSTLFVSPSGESLLVDTGWPGMRDAERISGVLKLAGIARIDYLVLTHYHVDHAGGVVELASRIPIRNFVDHGPTFDKLANVPEHYARLSHGARQGPAHIGQARRYDSHRRDQYPNRFRSRRNYYKTSRRRGRAQFFVRGFSAQG